MVGDVFRVTVFDSVATATDQASHERANNSVPSCVDEDSLPLSVSVRVSPRCDNIDLDVCDFAPQGMPNNGC